MLRSTVHAGDWVTVVNRLGTHSYSSNPTGVRCLSDQTSSLHISDVLPWTGRKILRAAQQEWNFNWPTQSSHASDPEISVLIPFRGTERLPLLVATIASLSAMKTSIEIIVIEQDEHSTLVNLPDGVQHLHAPHPSGDRRWHKCFAYNRGAERARAGILVCHDADVVVPDRYDECIRRHLVQEDYDVFYPGRFLFYLDQKTTQNTLDNRSFQSVGDAAPETIKQNWTGGTLAIKREAFDAVGGFDESFTGWTGEDREFYDRCQVLNGWFHGYIPFLHLWHAPQLGRIDSHSLSQADKFTASKLAIDRERRIEALKT